MLTVKFDMPREQAEDKYKTKGAPCETVEVTECFEDARPDDQKVSYWFFPNSPKPMRPMVMRERRIEPALKQG